MIIQVPPILSSLVKEATGGFVNMSAAYCLTYRYPIVHVEVILLH